jgi:NitT/TauT family transport system substrate-binding protein
VWASEKWVKANAGAARAFVEALREATDFVAQKPAEAARLYATSEKSKSSAEEILAIMKQDGIKYTMTPSGLLKFATFMNRIGMIKAVPANWQDYAFEHLHGLPGS